MMAIKKTVKYVRAAYKARELGLVVAVRHSTAEELYTELESLYYWDSKSQQWVERAEYDLQWTLKHKHSAEEITNLEARIAKLKGPSES